MSPEFLEIEKAESDGGEELRINGNRQGLIHFARLVLEVAEKDYEGSHQHLDEHGNVDRCDMPVVIVLKKYVWDIDRAG